LTGAQALSSCYDVQTSLGALLFVDVEFPHAAAELDAYGAHLHRICGGSYYCAQVFNHIAVRGAHRGVIVFRDGLQGRLVRAVVLRLPDDFCEGYKRLMQLFSEFVFGDPLADFDASVKAPIIDEKSALYKHFQHAKAAELRRVFDVYGHLPPHKRIISVVAQRWNDEGKWKLDRLSQRLYAHALRASHLSPNAKVKQFLLKLGVFCSMDCYRVMAAARLMKAPNAAPLQGPRDFKRQLSSVCSDGDFLMFFAQSYSAKLDAAAATELRTREALLMQQLAAAAPPASAVVVDLTWLASAKDKLSLMAKSKLEGKRNLILTDPIIKRYLTTPNIPGYVEHASLLIGEVAPFSAAASAATPTHGIISPHDIPAAATSMLISLATAASAAAATPAQATAATAASATSSGSTMVGSKRKREKRLDCVACCRVCDEHAKVFYSTPIQQRAAVPALEAHTRFPYSSARMCGACVIALCSEPRAAFGNKSCFEAVHAGLSIAHPLALSANAPVVDGSALAVSVVPPAIGLTDTVMKRRRRTPERAAVALGTSQALAQPSFSGSSAL